MRLATIRREGEEIAAMVLSDGVVPVGEIENLTVATVLNGEVRRENVVSNMTFSPWFLVSFHSKVMTHLPPNCTN